MTVHTETFPSPVVDVVGALELEPAPGGAVRIRRLPAWTRPQISDAVADFVVSMTSGVRLEFRTAATAIEVDLLAIAPTASGAPPLACVELACGDRAPQRRIVPAGDLALIDAERGIWRPGRVVTVTFGGLPAESKEVELWLPHGTATELHALRADAPIEPPSADPRPRWVHHGSSISQGGEADSPLGIWPAVAARRAGVRVHSLGFSGQAVADPYVARTMRDLPADVLSLEIGINIVNGDVMRRRAFGPALHGFLDTLREGHAETPIVLITPIPCPAVETLPGPTSTEGGRTFSIGDPRQLERGALSLSGIRDELHRIVRVRDDPFLRLVDGHRLLRPDEVADLEDGLHPNARALRRMGIRFADLVFGEPVSTLSGRRGARRRGR